VKGCGRVLLFHQDVNRREREGTKMTGIKRAERVKVRGIGRKNSRLLQEAGIDRLGQLLEYEHSPSSLRDRLAATNRRAGVVQRLPTEGMVLRWIGEGSALA
jgi:hypothetical protein